MFSFDMFVEIVCSGERGFTHWALISSGWVLVLTYNVLLKILPILVFFVVVTQVAGPHLF